MQGVKIEGGVDFDSILKKIPSMRHALHERIATIAHSEVKSNIDGTLNDSRGRVKSWQRRYVGSGGGYAAIRAENTSTGKNSPGAITNYLENGHRIRPAGKAKRRIRVAGAYVSGRKFYERSRQSLPDKARAEARRFTEQLAGAFR